MQSRLQRESKWNNQNALHTLFPQCTSHAVYIMKCIQINCLLPNYFNAFKKFWRPFWLVTAVRNVIYLKQYKVLAFQKEQCQDTTVAHKYFEIQIYIVILKLYIDFSNSVNSYEQKKIIKPKSISNRLQNLITNKFGQIGLKFISASIHMAYSNRLESIWKLLVNRSCTMQMPLNAMHISVHQ